MTQRTRSGRRWRRWALPPLSVAGVLLVLEVVLIPFPVVDARHFESITEHPAGRRQPGQYTWSRRWNFAVVNRVRVNNYGFVSDHDYDAAAESPLLAVVGDSFVEAVMVPYGQTCAGRLADRLAPRVRVYSFGVSGAPLSQYLAYAQYVREEFRPGRMVFVVVANDFLESLVEYSWGYPFTYFAEDDAGGLTRVTVPAAPPSRWRRIGQKSRLFRYLYGNLELGGVLRVAMSRRGEGSVPADGSSPSDGSAPADGSSPLDGSAPADGPAPLLVSELDRPAQERMELVVDSKRVIDHFFELLPEASGMVPAQVAFVVDGPRSSLYSDEARGRLQGSLLDLNRRHFIAAAEARGYEVVDLLPAFADHWRVNGARFDWPSDTHWNALGHGVCFEALAASALVSGMEAGSG